MSDRDDTTHRTRIGILARETRKQDKTRALEAYRERQLEQALLQSCLCLYPLEATHADWCPAEGMRLAAIEARRRREAQ